jgi:hypothetical protein
MSNYTGFDVNIRANNGVLTKAAGAVVKVYNATDDSPLPDLAADADGHVAAGTLAVPVGTLVYFSAALPDLRNGWAWQVTF